MNETITNSRGSNYEEKVNNALASSRENRVQFTSGNSISFSATSSSDKRIAFVIGVKK